MRKMHLIVALTVVVLLSMTVAAQTPPPVLPLLGVSRVVVKPDRVAEWSDIEKVYSEAYKKGGGPWRRIYRSRTANNYEFLVISPLSSYADLDGQSFIAKGASEQDLARWSARRNQCVESVSITYERLVPDAVINLSGASLPAILQETRYRVKQGMGTEFAELIKAESIPTLKKAGVGLFVLRRVEFGASRNLYVARRGASKFAEFEVNLVEKVLGREAAAKYFAKTSALLNDVETRLYSYQADISYSGQQ